MTPAYARELAEQWSQQTPEARLSVLEELANVKSHEFALVCKAIDGFYGAKAGPIHLRYFLERTIQAGPEMVDTPDDSDVVVDEVTPPGTTPVPD